ncbi:hypothetical protein [Ochrobactrum chromiisoli]|uniref:Uncharacterized protein n=1 Tax=Ochrobactrum chromiisoli TaxID=2993941 RepID=A0ABT3QKV3_9HYPH|nr:hypothetical protein [Ochrobactrum chromiisoli]MCX2696247.1 hypothetical protein [Ochrobactrum chromiisoli]
MNAIVKQDVKSIDDLLTAVDHSYQEVEILGMTTRLRPVTILECLRLVKRFPKLIDLFEPKLDKDGNLLPEELQPSLISVFMDSGIEAAAAFISCAAGKEGDLAFEQLITQKPDDLTLALFSSSVKVTLGDGSLEDFFTKITAALQTIFPKK